MTVTLHPRLRLALYLLTVLGTPVVVYLKAKGVIGDLELILWGAEVTAVSGLAALNIGQPSTELAATSRAEAAEYQRLYGVRERLVADIRDSNQKLGKIKAGIEAEHAADREAE